MKILFVLICLLSISAFAEPIGTRGGGKGVLCLTPGAGKTIESLDHYEAVHVYHLPIPPSLDYASEKTRMVGRVATQFTFNNPLFPPPYTLEQEEANTLSALNDIEKSLQFLPPGQQVPITNDAGPLPELPANCSFVQVVTYIDTQELYGEIFVSSDYWNLLSAQDKIAFLFHEWEYKFEREFSSAINSGLVRRITGQLMSSLPYPGVYSPLEGRSQALACISNMDLGFTTVGDDVEFWVIPNGNGSLLVFSNYGQLTFQAATTAASPIPYSDWINGKTNAQETIQLRSILDDRRAQLQTNPSGWNIAYGEPTTGSIQLDTTAAATDFTCEIVEKTNKSN